LTEPRAAKRFRNSAKRVTHYQVGPIKSEKAPTYGLIRFRSRLTETTSRQQQTQRTLLDWLRVE